MALMAEIEAVREVHEPFDGVNWDTHLVLSSSPPPVDTNPPAALYAKNSEAELTTHHFVVSRKACEQSNLLKDLLAPDSGAGPGEETVIPVQSTATALRCLVAYMEFHAVHGAAEPIPRPLPKQFPQLPTICEFDRRVLAQLVPSDEDHLLCIDVICVANYLGAQALLDLATAGLGAIFRGKTPDQLRGVFQMTCDLSDDEVKQIEAQNGVFLSHYPDA
jgi:hypothetical protein